MNIKYSTVRRVKITALMTEKETVLDWCYKNGYSLKRYGPKSIGPGMADVTRFLAIAEKVIRP